MYIQVFIETTHVINNDNLSTIFFSNYYTFINHLKKLIFNNEKYKIKFIRTIFKTREKGNKYTVYHHV